jgi:hypothetical protein
MQGGAGRGTIRLRNMIALLPAAANKLHDA